MNGSVCIIAATSELMKLFNNENSHLRYSLATRCTYIPVISNGLQCFHDVSPRRFHNPRCLSR